MYLYQILLKNQHLLLAFTVKNLKPAALGTKYIHWADGEWREGSFDAAIYLSIVGVSILVLGSLLR